jgi:hypothetical protein
VTVAEQEVEQHVNAVAPERVDLGNFAYDAAKSHQVFGNQECRQVDGLRELDLDT